MSAFNFSFVPLPVYHISFNVSRFQERIKRARLEADFTILFHFSNLIYEISLDDKTRSFGVKLTAGDRNTKLLLAIRDTKIE